MCIVVTSPHHSKSYSLNSTDPIVYLDSFYLELTDDYLKEELSNIDRIISALENFDFTAVEWFADMIKGHGGSFGFNAITDMGRNIEQAAKKRNIFSIRYWINELIKYVQTVQVIYV